MSLEDRYQWLFRKCPAMIVSLTEDGYFLDANDAWLRRFGYTREEILAYFERSYEGWVLLQPKAEGINVLLWLLPPLAVIAGLIALARYLGGRGGQKAAPEVGSEDDYLRRVREEVDA